MKPLWIVQTSLGNSFDNQQLLDAIRRNNAIAEEVVIKPFTSDLPEYLPTIDYDGPVLLSGSTSFCDNAVKHRPNWYPGIFSTIDFFNYAVWVEHWEEFLLNSSRTTWVLPIKDIPEVMSSSKTIQEYLTELFVRPFNDSKSIVGEVYTYDKLKSFYNDVMEGKLFGLTGDTKVVLGIPFKITNEWRLFVADGQVVTGSQYRRRGYPYKSAIVPDNVLDFGEKVILNHNPCSMFTLDVCESNGYLYLLEVQGFNGAGWYAADLDLLVQAANKEALKLWNQKQ